MYFDNLIIPMRAQPFHRGHEHLIATMSKFCDNGVIVLCRDYGDKDNPFSLELRSKWIEEFIKSNRLTNMKVAKRLNKRIARMVEYPTFFGKLDLSGITVLSTNQTDKIYRAQGFATCNHHSDEFVAEVWQKYPINNPIKLEGTGRVIRRRLRANQFCEDYLSKFVEYDAQKIIKRESQ